MISARRFRFLLSTLLLLTAAACALRAQPGRTVAGASTEGREFWVVFQKNFRDYTVDKDKQALVPAKPITMQLFITSGSGAKGVIEIGGISKSIPFTVAAGEVINIPIDSAAQLRSEETVDKVTVHIVADGPVTVYGLSSRYQTTDTYLAYPVDALGTSYRAMCYSWLEIDLLAQFAVIATQDNTRVRITPSVKTQKGRPARVPFDIVLNKGETYQVIPKYDPNTPSDLTGSLIEADKPVAVFSGHNCAYVPDLRTKACNHLVEQMPPIQSWGKQFFVGTLSGRSASVVRVLANTDNTSVFENNRLVATLKAGEFYENRNQTQSTMITSDHPILVAQYSKGFDNGDNVGDPMMIIIAPTEQFLANYRFATPIQGQWNHYLNVVAPNNAVGTLKLDGIPVDRKLFRQFGLSTYSIAQIEVPYGTHTLVCAQPFGLYSYGFGYGDAAYDAYGNGGGQSMEQVVEKPDTLAPLLEAQMKPGAPVITATVRDDRVNDRGVSQVTPLNYENLSLSIPTVENGTPQVQFTLKPIQPKRNGYVQFRLKDKAGNISYYTVCLRRNPPVPDSLALYVQSGRDATCDFPKDLQLSVFVKYVVMDNNVTVPAGSPVLNNPVALHGNAGASTAGFGATFEQPVNENFSWIGRVGFDVLRADLLGYFPDSLRLRAPDGTPVNEEFRLHRNSLLLTAAPGLLWYIVRHNAYLFGQINVALPLYTSEKFTRAILSPATYTYPNGVGQLSLYDSGDPSGAAFAITPELGIGSAVELRGNWRVTGELGVGHSLTTVSANRDWLISYWFARLGVKLKL